MKVTPDSAALVVVASSSADPPAAPLPEAEEQGHEVASYFRNSRLLSHHQTNRKDVLAGVRDAKVFHFVGHAVAEPSRVGLILSPDVTLTSEDFVKVAPRYLNLVVLSACETAHGEEGPPADVDSLARTFAVARVPQTIASRWKKVDSNVTYQLMHIFYSNLIAGMKPSAALRAAKTTIRTLPGFQHRYYWGSFTVIGRLWELIRSLVLRRCWKRTNRSFRPSASYWAIVEHNEVTEGRIGSVSLELALTLALIEGDAAFRAERCSDALGLFKSSNLRSQ